MSKANYGILNSSKNRTKLNILSKEDAQDSEFRSFFGRIKETTKLLSRFTDLYFVIKRATAPLCTWALGKHLRSDGDRVRLGRYARWP